jgi:fructose-1-phosphate kinase PfkB-like protein
MRSLRKDGAGIVVVSRAAEPALALVGEDIVAVRGPELEPTEPTGAGDSMTAGMVATLASGGEPMEALRTGAACGALNVVRRGLAPATRTPSPRSPSGCTWCPATSAATSCPEGVSRRRPTGSRPSS